MQSYIVRLFNLADQLKDFDEQCSESEMLYVLINGLDESYEHIKVQLKFKNQFHSMKHVISSFLIMKNKYSLEN